MDEFNSYRFWSWYPDGAGQVIDAKFTSDDHAKFWADCLIQKAQSEGKAFHAFHLTSGAIDEGQIVIMSRNVTTYNGD